MLDMLAASPNVLLSMVLLGGAALVVDNGQIPPWLLYGWVALALAAGLGRQWLIWRFRAAIGAGQVINRKRWARIAVLGPLSYALVYAAFVVPFFPLIASNGRLIISLIGAGLLVGAIGFSALAGRFMMVIVFASSAIGWALSDDPLALQVIAICAVGVWMYLPAQARQARQQLKYVELVRRAAELSAQLASRNDELERLGEERKFLVETASHDLRQ
ncbi:MAG: hypothetical protein EON93_22230, partial [Burkholderiales bacterium]